MNALAPFEHELRWVAWRNEIRKGKLSKVPYCPRSGRRAKADDPSTWSTRSAAEDRARKIVNSHGSGGIGIELGDLGNGYSLGGVDLDTCRQEDGTLEPWAVEVIERFKSYAEVSPSNTGAKNVFKYRTADLERLQPELSEGGGRSFKRSGASKDHPPAIEVFLKRRYFAITEQRIDFAPDEIVTVDVETLLWLLIDYGPAFAGAEAEAGGTIRVDLSSSPRKSKSKDNSRSAKAMRLGAKLKRDGGTFEEMCDAIRTDPETAEWYKEQGNNKRQLKRIWDRANAGRNLPEIQVTGGGLPAIVDRVDELIVEHDRELFQRAGMVVRPVMEKIDITDGGKAFAWHLVRVEKTHLVDRLTRIIDFRKYDKRSEEWISINCPSEVAAAYLQRVGNWRLPVIAGIVDAPTLRPDGTVIETPGYDEATGLLYKPSCEYASVLPNPTKETARAALDFLCELIEGFPFVGADGEVAAGKRSPSRSVALSLILTASARRAIPRAPMHGFDAPVPGSGKSLLVDTASMIASGHEALVMTVGKSEEEFEKRLGSALLAGDQMINLDNCERPLGGELLCQCLTQRRVKCRILGKSEQPTLPCDATLTATGNNLVLAGDVTRRAIVARLDPKVERPEEREFTENPIEMIRQDRATYVRAVLTVLRAFIIAGKPKQKGKPLGSYEDWSSLIRGALIWLGEPDPVATMEKVRNEDPVLRDLAEVLNCWFEAATEESIAEITVKRLIEVAISTSLVSSEDGDESREPKHPELRDALATVAGYRGGSIDSVQLGKWLGKNKGRIVNSLVLEHGSGTASGGVLRWRVVKPNTMG